MSSNTKALLNMVTKKLDQISEDLREAGIIGYSMSIEVQSRTIKEAMKGIE